MTLRTIQSNQYHNKRTRDKNDKKLSLLNNCPNDLIIAESLGKTYDAIQKYSNILCSVSGGSDSDILVDLCAKCDTKKKIKYVFFDTGIEYQATKNHLNYLEKRYGIKIDRIRPQQSVPLSCQKYGQPFLSKQVSEWMGRLQKHNFQWEDGTLEDLIVKYPNCKAALRWWCDDFPNDKSGRISCFNISYHKHLKEFIMANPPTFKISNRCCKYAKKDLAMQYIKDNNIELSIIGVRKAEGGSRAAAYSSCFSKKGSYDEFRPLLHYLDDTKNTYNTHYKITNSDCYSVYGLKRTGCVGCPFNRKFESEIDRIKDFEPTLYKCVKSVFDKTYKYSLAYKTFKLFSL